MSAIPTMIAQRWKTGWTRAFSAWFQRLYCMAAVPWEKTRTPITKPTLICPGRKTSSRIAGQVRVLGCV